MTLSDVLSRDMQWEWHEAVALLRDIAERVDENDPVIPELHQVELLSAGEVELHGGIAVADSVERLGQMLQLLLTRAEPPVQLRLLIAQHHDSISTFSESLAFYERPDRQAVLRGLYDRARDAVPVFDPDAFGGSLMPVDDKNIERSEPNPVVRSLWLRRLFYAAALLVIFAAGTVFALARRSDGPVSAEAAGLTSRVVDGISGATAAVGSVVAAIGEQVGIGGGVPDPTAPVEASPTPTSVGAAPPRRGSSVRAAKNEPVPAEIASVTAFDLDPSRGQMSPSLDVARSPGPTVAERVVRSQEGVIYSADTPGVSAPVGIRPQLPRELPPGVKPEDLTRIELTILPDGTVDSVKLIGQPRDIHDSMLLSAAKAWQFHPAMKDGFPVRYRKTIWVAR